uniref:Poly [ADP-ribose] polymerase n=1 Tax=Neogobius melanostomus TaxID=47308 RepID=A0A8C6UBF2_9GOBI
MPYRWAEEDFELPPGVERLGSAAPKDNRYYVMYHGTSSSSAQVILKSGFQQSPDGMLGRGVYLSRDLQKASRYPLKWPESDRVVIKVKVNVGKVIAINRQNHPQQKTWHDHGYDTAWVPPNCGMVPSGLEEDCVWDPQRIKIVRAIKPQPVVQPGGGGAYHYRSYVMYHGTSRDNAEKILKSGLFKHRDLQKASRYPLDLPEKDRVPSLRVKVNVGKVKRIDYQDHPQQKTWHDHGYDTAWVPPNCLMVKSGLEEDCVWDPRRIEVMKAIKPQPGGGGAFYNTVGSVLRKHCLS